MLVTRIHYTERQNYEWEPRSCDGSFLRHRPWPQQRGGVCFCSSSITAIRHRYHSKACRDKGYGEVKLFSTTLKPTYVHGVLSARLLASCSFRWQNHPQGKLCNEESTFQRGIELRDHPDMGSVTKMRRMGAQNGTHTSNPISPPYC